MGAMLSPLAFLLIVGGVALIAMVAIAVIGRSARRELDRRYMAH